jgi:dTDP-glucose pyrophosphorylase
MAGEGRRFFEAGYTAHKPLIQTTDHRTGKQLPMIVCAIRDLCDLQSGGRLICVDRDFHKASGVEDAISQYYPNARFITIDQLTEGQACTCLLAKDFIDNDEPLLIASCDNGMIYSEETYRKAQSEADVLVFTFRNDEAVAMKPNDYGWMVVDEEGTILRTSIKKQISDRPMNDHAVVGAFWFKSGSIFVRAAEDMIRADDRINNEFYVDRVIHYTLKNGYSGRVFELERYLGWGTPKDYERYQNTYDYWREFIANTGYAEV